MVDFSFKSPLDWSLAFGPDSAPASVQVQTVLLALVYAVVIVTKRKRTAKSPAAASWLTDHNSCFLDPGS